MRCSWLPLHVQSIPEITALVMVTLHVQSIPEITALNPVSTV